MSEKNFILFRRYYVLYLANSAVQFVRFTVITDYTSLKQSLALFILLRFILAASNPSILGPPSPDLVPEAKVSSLSPLPGDRIVSCVI